MAYSEPIAARIRKVLFRDHAVSEKKMFGGIAFLRKGKMLIGVLGTKVVARCRPADQPKLLRPPHIRPMNFTGKVMKGWLYVTGPSISSPTGIRRWIASGERAMAAAKPGRR